MAGDRLDGLGVFSTALFRVVAFVPSIILFGYAIRAGPSYIATVGLWAVGVYAANAVVGVVAFGDAFSVRAAVGFATACATVALVTPK